MAVDRSRISNMALTLDARTFSLMRQVKTPTEDDVVYFEAYADYPFEVVSIKALIAAGEVRLIPKIAGSIIDTDLGNTNGQITVNNPALITAIPDGAVHKVSVGQTLTVQLDNVNTAAAGLVIDIKCQRTDENAA